MKLASTPGRRRMPALGVLAVAAGLTAGAAPPGSAASFSAAAGVSCAAAAAAAERRYALPAGLLLAIGKVESGRPADGGSGPVQPWPWSVDAGGQDLVFASKGAAADWVRAAQHAGIESIDVGCFQINLYFHPDAFASLDDAFDPARNAEAAARFLALLHARLGDWGRATGAYHSQTARLADPYRRRVAVMFGAAPPDPAAPPAESTLELMRAAWRATLPPDGADGADPSALPLPPGAAAEPTAPGPAMLQYLPVAAATPARDAAAAARAAIWSELLKGR